MAAKVRGYGQSWDSNFQHPRVTISRQLGDRSSVNIFSGEPPLPAVTHTWNLPGRSLNPARPTLEPGAAPGATGAGPAPILAMATRHFRPEVSRAEAAEIGRAHV